MKREAPGTNSSIVASIWFPGCLTSFRFRQIKDYDAVTCSLPQSVLAHNVPDVWQRTGYRDRRINSDRKCPADGASGGICAVAVWPFRAARHDRSVNPATRGFTGSGGAAINQSLQLFDHRGLR